MELVGVLDGTTSAVLHPKREALLFDKIAITDLRIYVDRLRSAAKGYHDSDLTAIADQLISAIGHGVVYEPEITGRLDPALVDEFTELLYMRDVRVEELGRLEGRQHHVTDYHLRSGKLRKEVAELRSRVLATHLRSEGVNAYPAQFSAKLDGLDDRRAVILNLVVRELPVPSESDSWHDILAFRREPEAVGLMAGLREWVSLVARGDQNVAEVSDRLQYLLYRYRKAVQINRLRYTDSTMSIVIKTTVEAALRVATLQWTDLFSRLFDIREKRVALLEAEFNAPGHELAYVLRAEERFGSRGLTSR